MSQYQFQAPKLTPVNKVIVITTGVVFLVGAILKAIGAFSLVNLLGLSGSGVLSGFVFQFVTYPFIETQFMGILFNSLVVWFIGSELESQWGRKVYLRFLIVTVLVVGMIYTGVSLAFLNGTYVYSSPIHGLSGINFALLIAYATLYPDRQMSFMMIFPMTARAFCWILVGIEVYMAIFSSLANSWAHLLAMGVAYLMIRFQSKPLVRSFLHSSLIPKKQSKKHLYVVKDDDQDPPKYWQ
jgi:membrane associated rhomboid family serine protease